MWWVVRVRVGGDGRRQEGRRGRLQPDLDVAGRARGLAPGPGRRSGVHYQTIGYLERGEYSPSLHLALRIAEYFEIPVEVVFALKPFPRIGSDS